jgi:ABC-type multidrug transport system fused ATPase/permease subunit
MRELAAITRTTIARRPFTVALVAVCIAVAGLLQFVPPLLMGRVLGVLLAPGDHAAARAELTRLFTFVALGVCGILGFQFAANRGGTWLSTAVSFDLRARLHAALLAMDFVERSAIDAGTVQTRLTDDCAAVESFFGTALPTIAIQLIFVSGAVLLLALRAPFLAPLVGLPVIALALAAIALRRATTTLAATHSQRLAAFNARIAELAGAARAIRLLGREAHQQEAFEARARDARETQRRLWVYGGGFQHVLILNASLCAYAIWYVGGLDILGPAPHLAVTNLIAFVPIVLLLFQPVYTLAAMLESIPRAAAAAARIAALESLPREASDGDAAVPGCGTIAFDGVRFAYPGGPEVLHGITFALEPGEIVALTGPSGAGKSTLAHLACRLYAPAAGTIRWDGRDARTIAPRSWRRAIGVVMQETFVFQDSIRENIRCGRPWIDDAAVERAARLAHAHDFILAQADGYETILGNGAGDLSGGQRQRLGIARALAGTPSFFVFDEPTSALDGETEDALLDTLLAALDGRTLLVIAHRPATIARATRVLALDGGRLLDLSSSRR